jgi:hypothetical protein
MSIFKEVPKTVFIKRVPNSRIKRGDGDDARFDRKYIGASLKGSKPLSPFLPSEETNYLPSLIGVSHISQDWSKATKDYWNNIRREVPFDGIELEVGMYYNTEEEYNAKPKVGTPINLNDYVLYRYCLVYNKVANSIDDMYKSPNIDFYISDKEEEEGRAYLVTARNDKAKQFYFEIKAKETMVDDVLFILGYNPEGLTQKEKQITLSKISDPHPTDESQGLMQRFIDICEDKKLIVKAFIKRCVHFQILRQIPNTETIYYGDDVRLGSTIEECVDFLENGHNKHTLDTLEARLKGSMRNVAKPYTFVPEVETKTKFVVEDKVATKKGVTA